MAGGHVSRKQHWLPAHIQGCLEQGGLQPGTEAASVAFLQSRGRRPLNISDKSAGRPQTPWFCLPISTRSPNSCSYSNSPPLLLFSEHSLYYFQIHIWKRLPQAKSNFIVAFWLLSATEEILQTQPSNLRGLIGMSQGGKLDLRG